MLGLVLSGLTAIPLQLEVDRLAHWTGAPEVVQHSNSISNANWASWVVKVNSALVQITSRWPFLYYGTDWLAFGHFVIALAFVGALIDPVRNRWLFDFGIMACVLVIPYAFIFGAWRGIPFWWRLIDCSFGILGVIPLALCRRWTLRLDTTRSSHAQSDEARSASDKSR
jgi:hypothetical protein